MSENDAAEQATTAKFGQRSFAQNTLLMTFLTSISRVTGFLRLMTISYVIGEFAYLNISVSDSYYLANTIPNYIYELVIGGTLSSIVIPIFVEYLTTKNEAEAYKVARIFIGLVLIILGIIALIGTLLPTNIVRLQTMLSGSKNINLAIFFFRFFAVQIIFYGMGAIATGILHSYRRFGVPTFAPILNNITVIFTILFFVRPNLASNTHFAFISLAIGTTAGVFFLFVVQVPSLIKIGFKFVPSISFKHPAVKKAFILALPIFLYSLGNFAPFWAEIGFAWRNKSGVTAIVSAIPFFQLPQGIFTFSIVSALFPSLSENASKKNFEEIKKQIALGLRTIGLIVWPSSVALIVFSKPIVFLTLQHGRFTPAQANLTAGVLSYFGLGLFFFSGFYFLLRPFYAMQNTITPAIISLITMIFNIVIDFLLVRIMSVYGLALGRSLTYLLNFILIWIFLERAVGKLDKRIIHSNAKFLLSSLIMGVVGYFSLNFITPLFQDKALTGRFIIFLVPAAISIASYISSITILKSEEIHLIKGILSKRFSKNA